MYQVIVMYGDNEPWWFFEDWQKDIQKEQVFENFTDAKAFYEEVWLSLRHKKMNMEAKPNYLCAFWNDEDDRWCEECGDYITQYTGLVLLKDHEEITEVSDSHFFEKSAGHDPEIKCCKRRLAAI